jgi:hypothetical protein
VRNTHAHAHAHITRTRTRAHAYIYIKHSTHTTPKKKNMSFRLRSGSGSSSTTTLLLESPAAEGVRRLARRISIGMLRDKDKERLRPGSAASSREAEGVLEKEREVKRLASRLWRRRTASSPPPLGAGVGVVMEEEEVLKKAVRVEVGEGKGKGKGKGRWWLPAAGIVRRRREEGVYDLRGLVDGGKVGFFSLLVFVFFLDIPLPPSLPRVVMEIDVVREG